MLLASEATADLCQEAPHWSFVVDVTVENSKTAPPGTRLEQNVWQGPMVLSTMSVDPRRGEKYPRGNYCTRGARFGVHSSEENFRNPYSGRVTFLAYFTGGVRAFDRGFIYATDRNGSGLDILELHGKARSIGLGMVGHHGDHDDDD